MEKETEKQNLGSGSIPGLMIKLAVPTIIAQLVNLLYNLVDRIYIGHIREVGYCTDRTRVMFSGTYDGYGICNAHRFRWRTESRNLYGKRGQ